MVHRAGCSHPPRGQPTAKTNVRADEGAGWNRGFPTSSSLEWALAFPHRVRWLLGSTASMLKGLRLFASQKHQRAHDFNQESIEFISN